MAYAFHLLYKVTDPKGNYEEYYYQYDAYVDAGTPPHQADRFQFGNLLRKTSCDAAGQTIAKETYTYEPFFNQVLTHTGPRGYEPGADPADYTTSNSYDFMELPAGTLDNWLAPWYIDRTGFASWQGADLNDDSNTGPNFGSLIRTDLPDVTLGIAAEQGDQSASVLYRYNDAGQLLEEEDAEGRITAYHYFPADDPNGDGIKVEAGDRVFTGGGYLEKTIVDSEIGGFGLTTHYTYDFTGNLTSELNPRGYRMVYFVNDWNEIYKQVSGDVDAYGLPLSSDFTQKEYLFDDNGNITTMKVVNNNADTGAQAPYLNGYFQYDVLDRLHQERWECFNPVTGQYEDDHYSHRFYDNNGNLVAYVAPNGTVTSATYNIRNLVESKTRHGSLYLGIIPPTLHADDATITFTYDKNSNLEVARDGEGDAFSIGYNALDRRVSLTDPLGTFTEHTRDAAGNITKVTITGRYKMGSTETTGLKEAEYLYDGRDRLYEASEQYFALDAGGNQIPINSGAHPGYGQSRLGMDRADRITVIEDDNGHRTNVVYDSAPLCQQQTARKHRRLVGRDALFLHLTGPIENSTLLHGLITGASRMSREAPSSSERCSGKTGEALSPRSHTARIAPPNLRRCRRRFDRDRLECNSVACQAGDDVFELELLHRSGSRLSMTTERYGVSDVTGRDRAGSAWPLP